MHFTKLVDKASPNLFVSCTTGKHIKSATIACRSTEAKQDFLKIELEEIIISSYEHAAANNDSPTETISLNFTKIQVKYTPQPPVG